MIVNWKGFFSGAEFLVGNDFVWHRRVDYFKPVGSADFQHGEKTSLNMKDDPDGNPIGVDKLRFYGSIYAGCAGSTRYGEFQHFIWD